MKETLLEKGEFILKQAETFGADQAEVSIILQNSALTRIANSIIDQNIAERHALVNIILYYGKKKGSVNVEVFDKPSLKQAVESAAKIAKISSENKDFESIPSPKPYSDVLDDADFLSKASEVVDPETRADFATLAIQTAHEVDKRIFAVAGAISNETYEWAILNSLGVEAYQVGTTNNVDLTIVAKDGDEETAGWAKDVRRNFHHLNVEVVADRAARKASTGFGMINLEPGDYEVILEPAALADLMEYVCYIGFNAKMYQEYNSFLIDRIGEKLFSDKLSFWDNGLDTRFPMPMIFDSEGYPKSKLELITDGVVKNLIYDTHSAEKDRIESTGHSYRYHGRSFPYASHLIIAEGDSSLDEMISETKKGILITHFHYQNPINPNKGVFTGLTRDGTWLIENGEVKSSLKTLRYTDAVTRFLSEIDLVGKYHKLHDSESIVPPVKLPSFRISGSQKE